MTELRDPYPLLQFLEEVTSTRIGQVAQLSQPQRLAMTSAV